MAYNAVGTIVVPDLLELKQSTAALQKEATDSLKAARSEINSRINSLDSTQVQVIKARLETITTQLNMLLATQAAVNSRVTELENCVANLEVTTDEITSMWRN